MAASRMIRRKQAASAWPGYFSSAPTAPARMALDLVDDDELDHIERLRNHGVVRDVTDDIDVGDIARPRRVLPDLDLGPGRRIVGVDGEPLPIGGGRGELDAYLTGTPGQADDTGPGDFRNHWRLGMASEDEPETASEFRPDADPQDLYNEAIQDSTDLLAKLYDLENARDEFLRSARASGNEPWQGTLKYFDDQIAHVKRQLEVAASLAVIYRRRVEEQEEQEAKKKKKKGGRKPRPDDDVGGPSPQERARAAERWTALLEWGNPAVDYKLGGRQGRRPLANLPASFWEELRELLSGGGTDTYDRLGNQTSRRLRRQLSDQEKRALRYGIRANHPAINWGDLGPPVPPAPRLSVMDRLRVDVDDD